MRGRAPWRMALCGLSTLVAVVAEVSRGEAQMDPEPRANLELGVEGPLRGDGPISGYFFLLWNQPHVPEEDRYLRVVVAPVYLHSELVFDKWPGRNQAVGLGAGGGYKPFDHEEFRDGGYQERESFLGHGAEVQLSYYPRVKLWDVLPLEGQIRIRPQYVLYERGDDTDRRFRLPRDSPVHYGRAGLRPWAGAPGARRPGAGRPARSGPGCAWAASPRSSCPRSPSRSRRGTRRPTGRSRTTTGSRSGRSPFAITHTGPGAGSGACTRRPKATRSASS